MSLLYEYTAVEVETAATCLICEQVAELEAQLDAPALKAVAQAAVISSHMKLYTQFREERAAAQRPSSSSSGGSCGLAAPPVTERGPSAARRQGASGSGNGKGSATVRK